MLFHKDAPGFNRLVHDTALDIRDKYMVVHTWWEDIPVFFHNVYAPVPNEEREEFFEALPRNFPANAKHIVMGDFNLPLDRECDAKVPSASNHTGRMECVGWLQALGVVDAWRIHHPLARVFSSPRRKNRLDYIFLDEELMRQAYARSEYFSSDLIVEHMCHKVILQPIVQSRSRAYWKLPKELLEVPQVADTIRAEANRILQVLREANNPGVVWMGWKKRTKSFLQQYHAQYLVSKTRVIDKAKRLWLSAQSDEA
ncbi:hypothetical protein DAPPUDRAFT_340008, partial [Daphnia pulex]